MVGQFSMASLGRLMGTTMPSSSPLPFTGEIIGHALRPGTGPSLSLAGPP